MEAAAGIDVTGGVEAVASILPSKLNLNPITQLSPVVIVATMLIIIATYFLLRRVYVLPYLQVIEEREALFEQAEVRYVDAAQSVEQAEADSERVVAEAAAEAEAMRAEAHTQAEEYRHVRVTQATNEAAARLEEGRAQIAAARTGELGRLQTEAAECVSLACGQLVGDVDKELVAATVERLMTRQAN